MEIISHNKYIKFRPDYAERLLAQFETWFISHSFGGNNYLFIEGAAQEYYKNDYGKDIITKNKFDVLIG